MAMVSRSKDQYDPEDDLRAEGEFRVVCVGVKQNIENKNYPDGKPLIVIEFRVHGESPANRGKKVAIVCSESLYQHPKTGKKSRFLAHAESMGVYQPLNGFDPDVFLDKQYTVTVIETNGKYYVDHAVPYVAPTGTPVGAKKAKTAPVQPAPAKDEAVPF